ncbi:MAG: hypothetical protein ABJD11_01715 [Gemmatimonadota bacterium]
MSIKSVMGLDWFDLGVHVVISILAMTMASSAANGPDGDVAVSMVAVASLLLLAWRRARALKRLGLSEPDNSSPHLEELESRIADLEAQHGRVLELEERVDFTERMLANQRALAPAAMAPELLPKRDQGS